MKKFTQELRLQSGDDRHFEWLLGGYYTDEKTLLDQAYLPFNLTTRALVPMTPNLLGAPIFVVASIGAKYRELAAFANGTYHFSNRFDVTGGLRYSHDKQSSVQQVNQLAVGGAAVRHVEGRGADLIGRAALRILAAQRGLCASGQGLPAGRAELHTAGGARELPEHLRFGHRDQL